MWDLWWQRSRKMNNIPRPVWIWLCSAILLFLAPEATGDGLALGKCVELQSVRGKGKFGKRLLSSLHTSRSIYGGKG